MSKLDQMCIDFNGKHQDYNITFLNNNGYYRYITCISEEQMYIYLEAAFRRGWQQIHTQLSANKSHVYVFYGKPTF